VARKESNLRQPAQKSRQRAKYAPRPNSEKESGQTQPHSAMQLQELFKKTSRLRGIERYSKNMC
jgi:hypothetical protein